MTETEYLKQMISLIRDLDRAASADPYDPDEYNKVINAIHSTNDAWSRSRRISSGVLSFAYISAILFVLYLIYCLLSEALEWGR